MKLIESVKKNSVIIYYFLTFIISWGFVLFLAGFDNFPINPKKVQDLLPVLYMSMLLGPSVAGLLLTGIVEGRAGYKSLFSGFIKWRLHLRWYLFAFLTAPLLAIFILLVLSLFSPEFHIGFIKSENAPVLVINGLVAGIFVGIFEETGWTGFVFKRSLNKNTFLKTGFITGLFWGAWHFILFFEDNSVGGLIPFLILTGRLFAWLPPYRMFMAWMYRQTESLLLSILAHFSLVFTVTSIVPMTLKGKDLLVWLIAWSLVLWGFVIILTFFIKKNTRRSKKMFMQQE